MFGLDPGMVLFCRLILLKLKMKFQKGRLVRNLSIIFHFIAFWGNRFVERISPNCLGLDVGCRWGLRLLAEIPEPAAYYWHPKRINDIFLAWVKGQKMYFSEYMRHEVQRNTRLTI